MGEQPGTQHPVEQPPLPRPADFDAAFTATACSPGVRRVWQAAEPDLPGEIEPFSFLSVGMLQHVAAWAALAPGQTLVDLACGRGGPGLWLARASGAALIGIDFSPVAVDQAARRAARFGVAGRARFVLGDLTATGLADATADAVICVDALHFAADLIAGAAEALRILRPGGRLAFTNWQPREPTDQRLLPRLRHRAWAPVLTRAGFVDIWVDARPEWHRTYTRLYELALNAGSPGDDAALAGLQHEARAHLPTADLEDRVIVTARRADPR